MKIRLMLVLAMILIITIEVCYIPVALAEKPEWTRYCVTYEKSAKESVKYAIKARFGDIIKSEIKLADTVLVVLPPEKNIKELKMIPGVKEVVPDLIFIDPAGKPSGEKLPWGVDRIDADLVWDVNHDMVVDSGANIGEGIKVAILDTGIDIDHGDLMANIKGGVNYVGIDNLNLNNYDDTHGHGTGIGGIIAGVDNTQGVIGVAPGAHLYGVKVRENLSTFPDGGYEGYLSDHCEGMQWCITGPDGRPGTGDEPQVINMSFTMWTVKYVDGQPTADQPYHYLPFYNLVQQAYDAGIVQVAAVGNQSELASELPTPPEDASQEMPGYRFPASYPQVIGVSATGKVGKNDVFASFSNFGSAVDLAAPGASIYTTTLGGSYGTGSGTSYSCPHVVGVAALVLKQFPGLSPGEVRTRLKNTAEWIKSLTVDQQGSGMVDAQNAALGIRSAPPLFSDKKLTVTWGNLKGD